MALTPAGCHVRYVELDGSGKAEVRLGLLEALMPRSSRVAIARKIRDLRYAVRVGACRNADTLLHQISARSYLKTDAFTRLVKMVAHCKSPRVRGARGTTSTRPR